MNWALVIDLYLFLVTGAGFWGALVLARFFFLRWNHPVMRALTIFFVLLSLWLGWLMLAMLFTHFTHVPWFDLSPFRQTVFRTGLTGGIWLLVWQVRVKRLP